jgi:hypothetical protein
MKRLAMALLLGASSGWCQCVMCFRTAAAQNAARAHLLNIGIVLLGLPPFCILAGFLYLAWRRNEAFDETEHSLLAEKNPAIEQSGTAGDI